MTRRQDGECLLVVPDLPGGELSFMDRDLLRAARRLGDRENLLVVVVAFDASTRLDWQALGADRLVCRSRRHDYEPMRDLGVVAAAFDTLKPRHLLFPDSLPGMGDIGRRLAESRRLTLAAGVCSTGDAGILIRHEGALGTMDTPPTVLLVVEERGMPAIATRCEARPLPLALRAEELSADLQLLEVQELDVTMLPLEQAELVIAAGDGVSDWNAFHRLAKSLNATIAGSRVVCDKGLLPKSRQVGSSGESVCARGYLAFGISGAPQHLQGITRCGHVIAVNIDAFCPMVKRADLAIVADAQSVMRALIEQLQRRSAPCQRAA